MGPGESLFTESFYSDCKKCLKAGGIMVTQSGVPFMQPQGIKNMQTMLRTFFESVDFYLMPVPTYIGGTMVIGFASDNDEYTQQSLQELSEKSNFLNERTQYYTPKIHQASFVIPPFIQNLLK
jgi:spermidine synthase